MARGGKREGAGRPAMQDHRKRVPLVISVAPETRDWMRGQSAEQGVPMGVILEELIESFEDSCKENDL